MTLQYECPAGEERFREGEEAVTRQAHRLPTYEEVLRGDFERPEAALKAEASGRLALAAETQVSEL